MKTKNTQKGQGIIEVANKKRYLHLLEKMKKGKALSRSEIKELKEHEKTEAASNIDMPPGTVQTQREVAKAFGVSVRTVRNWVADDMPKTEEGHYDLIVIKAWHDVKIEKNKPVANSDKEHWEVEFRKRRAQLYDLQFKEKLGEVVSIEEVEKGRVARIMAVKTALLALPKICAPALVGMEAREIQAYLKGRVEDIIIQFSGQREKVKEL